jgi:class 3 adenylate cyclase/pimeloyl-ACP methyl ester carboxylesterase
MLEVEYALRGDMSIAYQVIGDGPLDLIVGAGLVSHLDLMWADPNATSFLRQLGEIGRLILFDKPGTGLSDPVVGVPTLEQRVQDFLAVLDAAGSRRATVIGISEAAAPAALLAATYPERVEALVLVSGTPRTTCTEDYLPELEDYVENRVWKQCWHSAEHWGDGSLVLFLSPYFRNSTVYRRLAPSFERACTSPGMARSIIHGMREYDALPALDAIRAPTLVVQRTEEYIPVSFGRDFAERIAGAELTELPGDEHIPFFGGDDITEAIGVFLGGSRQVGTRTARALTTVLFTDIVESTATAATLGDEHWHALLEHHDRIAGEEVERHGGRLVKKLGDGVLATFDRPLLSIRCAGALVDRLGELGLTIRVGIHSGECNLVDDDVTGIAVHIGSRVAGLGAAGEVLVSSTVRDLVLGSGVQFTDRGVHQLKGVPGDWNILAVSEDPNSDQRAATPGCVEGRPQTSAAAATMRPLDKVLLRLASRAPWLTRPALRLVRPRPIRT